MQTSPEVDATAAAAVKIRESESRADPTCLAFFGEVGEGGRAGMGWRSWGGEGGGLRLEWIMYIIACLSPEHLAKSPKAPL